MTTEYELRPYQPGDEDIILIEFNKIFRDVCGEGYVDRTMAQWRWEFEQNPAGHRIVIAWTTGGELAGHFGGVPTILHTSRGDAEFCQGVDNFVLPAHRKGLARPGMFVQLGRAWQAYCKEQGTHVIYGYPITPAQRGGSKFLKYVPIWVVDYLVRPAQDGSVDVPDGIVVEEAVGAPPPETDALFAKFAEDQTCLVRRDTRYLQWRYYDNPGAEYVVLAARQDGALVGLAVLHPGHELIPGCCTVVDWVVPGCDPQVLDALLARTTEVARERGRDRVMGAFAPQARERAAFLERGFHVEPSDMYLERRLNHILVRDDWGVEWVRDNWWHTLGESDMA